MATEAKNDVMQIVIDTNGAVTSQLYDATGSLTGSASSWALADTDGDTKYECETRVSSTVYYGIEAKLATAETYNGEAADNGYTLRANTALTPDLA